MQIGNWEVWKTRTSEDRYEFTASNGVTIRLYEQFDEDYSVTLDGRTCSTDLDSPTKWKYDDTGEPAPEDEFLMADVSASKWYARACVNDECVAETDDQWHPEAQAQALAQFAEWPSPEIAAAGREALDSWNTERPEEQRPQWFHSLAGMDPVMLQHPVTWVMA